MAFRPSTQSPDTRLRRIFRRRRSPMQRALSPYAAAGVALATASVIAATPVIDTAPHLQSRTASTSVELAALTNSVVDPWITQFNAASANMTQLAHEYFLAPGPDVQQAV